MSHGDQLIQDFVAGRYHSIDTGEAVQSPIQKIEIVENSAAIEAELLAGLQLGANPIVVADTNTIDVLGSRVAQAIGAPTVILDNPKASFAQSQALAEQCRNATSLIAVGSGTINDLCKDVAHNTRRPSLVFATAPSMNGYTTKTVSIDKDGVKLSLPSTSPIACIFDLTVLANSPARLIRAGVGDAICRGTAQIDWLLSHNFLRTPYLETPFDLQLADEKPYLDLAPNVLSKDLAAIAALTRILILGGLGAVVAGSSHPGSMGEHGISHYIDMYAAPHPGALHGEQVGIATITMARLQERMLAKTGFAELATLPIDRVGMTQRFGDHSKAYVRAIQTKNDRLAQFGDPTQRLNGLWDRLKPALTQLAIPATRIEAILSSIGAATKLHQIGLDPAFYRQAVRHTFEIRDRYSMLDLAVQAAEIDEFIDEDLAA